MTDARTKTIPSSAIDPDVTAGVLSCPNLFNFEALNSKLDILCLQVKTN